MIMIMAAAIHFGLCLLLIINHFVSLTIGPKRHRRWPSRKRTFAQNIKTMRQTVKLINKNSVILKNNKLGAYCHLI